MGEAASIRGLNKLLQQFAPDVIFLDVRLPGPSGIDFLECIPNRPYEVILVTAYSNFGIRALKAGALDYILKPIDPDEMKLALDKLRKKKSLNNIRLKNKECIHIPHAKGVSLFSPSQIVRIEADNNYATIFFLENSPLTVAKTIKEFSEKLRQFGFFRAHKSHLINLKHVQSYSKLEGGVVQMADGEKIRLAKRRTSQFHELIKHNSILIK